MTMHDRAMLTHDSLDAISGVRHGFFTREGGVSEGIYASLNCGLGSGDDTDKVTTNRGRVAAAVDLKAVITAYQIHSPTVVEVDKPWTREQAPRADAMVTTQPGIALGILTADCAPVLFADRKVRVVGAAHAGWRGAITGVLDATVAAMARHGARPESMVAAVGPCIAQASYEVGPEFPAPFLAEDPPNAGFFKPSARAGHFMFDLSGYVARRLRKLGISTVTALSNDTCREEDRFFSYRRACLRGDKDYGRGISVIALAP
jgi:YfiH family protein